MSQSKQSEWRDQWQSFEDNERFLFEDWIYPNLISDFKDKEILEAGCGGGHHTCVIAEIAKEITAVDLNTVGIAEQRLKGANNVIFIEDDIAAMNLGRTFDIVLCIGVIHHTEHPAKTFENLYRHVRAGGRLIIWAYSLEGNALVRNVVEPIRKLFIRHLPSKIVEALSSMITLLMYPVVHTIYRAEAFSFLPYHAYFKNFRRMNFRRNMLNVFDKLNAPQTYFIQHATVETWFDNERFDQASVHISHYAGVSYRLSGTKIAAPPSGA